MTNPVPKLWTVCSWPGGRKKKSQGVWGAARRLLSTVMETTLDHPLRRLDDRGAAGCVDRGAGRPGSPLLDLRQRNRGEPLGPGLSLRTAATYGDEGDKNRPPHALASSGSA
jgi:hypothetical protein